MTQQPFSRPGAIDLSGLKRPASAPPSGGGGVSTGSAGVGGSAYSVDVDEQNFQALLEASMTAPVVLVFYSTGQAPESATMARDVATVADEYDGRFLAGLIDIDASPAIGQAMQIPQVPMLFVLLDGRPATQPIPGLIGLDELRTLFNQLGQQLTAQGITGRHQPRSAPVRPRRLVTKPRSRPPTRGTPPPRTPWARATSTRLSRSTRSWSTATPPTPRPQPGSRWPRCCSAPRALT